MRQMLPPAARYALSSPRLPFMIASLPQRNNTDMARAVAHTATAQTHAAPSVRTMHAAFPSATVHSNGMSRSAVRGLHATSLQRVHASAVRLAADPQATGGEEDVDKGYEPPFPAVVFEASGVVFRSGQEASFRVNGDVRDAVQCLKFDGVKTALVCQGGDGPLTEGALRDLEIGKHFNALFTPGGRASLGQLVEALGVPASKCIYVGETEGGLAEAGGMGMTVIRRDGRDQDMIVRDMEEACETSLVNFAWTRDIYAGVLWKNNKDCARQDGAAPETEFVSTK